MKDPRDSVVAGLRQQPRPLTAEDLPRLAALTAEERAMREHPEPRTPAEVLAAVPSDEDRAQRAADLTERVRLVQAEGWARFRWTWSSGEVAGVALVLGDGALVDEVSGCETAALDTWAAELWGITDGADDARAGHPRTRAWFEAISNTSG